MNYNLNVDVQQMLTNTLPADDKGLEGVAACLGTTPKLLNAFRSRDLKVPLDRAFAIADALKLDRAAFFAACLNQFLSESDMAKFMAAFGNKGDPMLHPDGCGNGANRDRLPDLRS